MIYRLPHTRILRSGGEISRLVVDWKAARKPAKIPCPAHIRVRSFFRIRDPGLIRGCLPDIWVVLEWGTFTPRRLTASSEWIWAIRRM